MRFPLISVLALAVITASSVSAEESVINDLRVMLGSGPSKVETEFTASALGGSITSSDSESADSTWQIGMGYTAAFDRSGDGAGLLWSIGLTSSGYEDELDNGEKRTFSAFALELGLGLGIPLGHGFHLEAAPFLALGGASGKADRLNGQDIDGDAFYWAAGVRAGGFFTFDNGLQLGLELRYTHGRATFEDEDTIFGIEVDTEVDVTISGVGVLASVGYRF